MTARSIQRAIRNGRWYRKSFEGTAFALYQWQRWPVVGQGPKFPGLPIPMRRAVTLTQGTQVTWLWDQRDLERLWLWWRAKIVRDSQFVDRMLKRWEVRRRLLEKEFRALDRLKLLRLTADELGQRFNHLMDVYSDSSSIAALSEGFSLIAEHRLADEFLRWLRKRKLAHRFSELFPALTQTTRPSFIQEADRAKARGVSARALARQFYWINFNYFHTVPLTARDFARRHTRPLSDLNAVSRRKRELFRSLRLPSGLQRLFAAADELTWWQDQRKKYALRTTEWMYRFLREVGRRQRLPMTTFYRTIPPELSALARGDVSLLRTVRGRKDPVVVYVDSRRDPIVLAGRDAEPVARILAHASAVTQLRGTATQTGRVRGRVIVLRGVADMRLVRRGDVLIASMTRPEFTPVLRQAGAIVTDEGGITSHAAIISREFGIPCIIGTKIATHIFHNGDRVEVDAERGIVRKVTGRRKP